MTFDVHVAGDEVRVQVKGGEPVAVRLPGRDMSGPMGVGARAGSDGMGRGIEVQAEVE